MNNKKTKVAAVECQTYEIDKLQAKIKEAITLSGGFPAQIKPGAKILLKPNLLTATAPEAAVTTHPNVVKALIRILKEKGVTDITFGDSPAGKHSWEKLWGITGMKKVAEEENVNLIPFENFKTITIENIPGLEHVPVLKELDDFDAVISLPKLKTHLLTKVTGAVKNSYGLIIGSAKSNFHGSFPSPRKMSDFIGRLYGRLKPDFVIMDAIECMEGDGPNYGKVKQIGAVIAGSDAVAIDSCACEVYGYTYTEINILKTALELGYGVAGKEFVERTGNAWDAIANTKAKRAKADFLFKIPEKLFFVVTYFAKCRPVIDKKVCIRCGLCAEACSQKAITISKKKCKIQGSKCVLCMCCIEACPYHAIELNSSFWKRFLP
jgi:uncharacterized protein (DUF362 family)/Pyruvate/2-oxoacid:ferredoxin oxidoreductase delta subunit